MGLADRSLEVGRLMSVAEVGRLMGLADRSLEVGRLQLMGLEEAGRLMGLALSGQLRLVDGVGCVFRPGCPL